MASETQSNRPHPKLQLALPHEKWRQRHANQICGQYCFALTKRSEAAQSEWTRNRNFISGSLALPLMRLNTHGMTHGSAATTTIVEMTKTSRYRL